MLNPTFVDEFSIYGGIIHGVFVFRFAVSLFRGLVMPYHFYA